MTRSCVGVWEIRSGRLISKLADSRLGAIVTHAEITPDGKYIVSSETGKVLMWNRVSEQVLFRDDQLGIQQIKYLQNGEKVLVISCKAMTKNKDPAHVADDEKAAFQALAIVRTVPGLKYKLFNKHYLYTNLFSGFLPFCRWRCSVQLRVSVPHNNWSSLPASRGHSRWSSHRSGGR